MSDRKVKIQSMVDHSVVLSIPYLHFERVFSKELQSAKIDFDILEEGLQNRGFSNFFRKGILKITDKKDRVDLGLESNDEDDYIPEIVAMSTSEILLMLKDGDLDKLKDTLDKASTDLRENFIKTAIKFKVHDYSVIETLQQYTNHNEDIQNLIKLSRDAEKPVEEE